MNQQPELRCCVCSRKPTTEPLDLLALARDPSLIEQSEAFHLCDAPGCARIVCPEHAVLYGDKSFCLEHGTAGGAA